MSEKIVTIGGRQYELSVSKEGKLFRAGDRAVEVVSVSDREAELRIDGRTYFVPFAIEGTQISFAFGGEIYFAEVVEKGARAKAKHRDHSLGAPMPGIILAIRVQQGEVVAKGAPLLILEAMKMEHQIVAPYDGRVVAVNCREGELVQPGLDLIDLEKQ